MCRTTFCSSLDNGEEGKALQGFGGGEEPWMPRILEPGVCSVSSILGRFLRQEEREARSQLRR